MHAGLRRRHPEHAEERRERDGRACWSGAYARGCVECPQHPVVVGERDAPRADLHCIDVHFERSAGSSPANLDRTDERVPVVQLRIEVVEVLPLRNGVPACVESGEAKRVAGIDRQDRRQVA